MSGPDVLWYINPTDGDVPWEPEHRFAPTFDALRQQARTLDRLGFYGALTTAREAISLVGDTEQLRFLIPEYPGVKPPVLMAEEAQVFDQYSGGRLIYNQVNGADPVLHRYGRFESKADRYRMSAEFWTQVKRLYLDDTEAFQGEFFSYGPRYKPAIPGNREAFRSGAPVRQPRASRTRRRSSTSTCRSCRNPALSQRFSTASGRPQPSGADRYVSVCSRA